MIDRSICFVLGAGASVPYGLPTGPGLKDLLVEQCARKNRPECSALLGAGFGHDELTEFVHGFRMSRQSSIDSFLASRPQFFGVGKAAIAATILTLEQSHRLHPSDPTDDWISHVWTHLQSPKQASFAMNRLSFVTFNYDRSVEQSLCDAYSNTYGVTWDVACARVEETIPIVHVHGSLGALPTSVRAGVPYDLPLEHADLKDVAAQITVLSEAHEDSSEVSSARALVAGAHRVVFLGCAYHRENMRRLGVGDKPLGAERIGSGYGLTEREADNLSRTWFVQINKNSLRNLDFLRADLTF